MDDSNQGDVCGKFVTGTGQMNAALVYIHLMHCAPPSPNYRRFDTITILLRCLCANTPPEKMLTEEPFVTARRTNPLLAYALKSFEKHPTDGQRAAITAQREEALRDITRYDCIATDAVGLPTFPPIGDFLLHNLTMRNIWSWSIFETNLVLMVSFPSYSNSSTVFLD